MSVHPLMVFQERAEARALLAYAGIYDADAAIDALLDDAFRSGLIDDVGAGTLYDIIAAAFAKYEEAA